MPNVTSAVVCVRAIIDRQSNGISLVEIVEEMNVPGLPEGAMTMLPVTLDVVSFWARSDAKIPEVGEARFRFMAPNGTSNTGGMFPVDLKSNPRLRNIARLVGLPLAGPGEYVFVFEFRRSDKEQWTEKHRLVVPITNKPDQAQPKPAQSVG